MAKKKEKKCPPLAAWLVTFSDLVTLLLTFFVLLLSMASMDQSFMSRINISEAQHGHLDVKGAGRVDPRAKLVSEMVDKPWQVFEKEQRIKDLLFPDDVLPPEVSRQDLDKNLKVLAKNDGVALVFTDKLLFEPGSSLLTDPAKELLSLLLPSLAYIAAPMNISSFTDSVELVRPEREEAAPEGEGALPEAPALPLVGEQALAEEQLLDRYRLSGDRAVSVLGYLVEQGVPNNLLSLSAYGPEYPIADNATPEGRQQNRRVELLLKTARPMGGYGP